MWGKRTFPLFHNWGKRFSQGGQNDKMEGKMEERIRSKEHMRKGEMGSRSSILRKPKVSPMLEIFDPNMGTNSIFIFNTFHIINKLSSSYSSFSKLVSLSQ